jgi:hypothetical protein
MVQRDLDERTFRKSTAGARAKCRAADSSTQYEGKKIEKENKSKDAEA